MRRLLGMIMLLLAAGTVSPAAAAAVPRPGGDLPQQFGVRLADVPAAAARNPRAPRYIVDYLSTGTAVHRRILVVNHEARTARFTVYPDAAKIAGGLFTGDAGQARNEHRSAQGWPSLLVQVGNVGGRASQQMISLAPGQPGAPPRSLSNGPGQARVTLTKGLTTSGGVAAIEFAPLAASHPGLSVMAWLSLSLVAAVAVLGAVAFIGAGRAIRRRRAPAWPNGPADW